MSGEQPTQAGASVTERIEQIISGGQQEAPVEQQTSQEAQEATEVEAPKEDGAEEVEGPQYELSDVAKILGVDESILDVDEDGTLKIKTKIDGAEAAAKLKDFLTSYQLKGHLDNRVRQAAETEKQLAAQQQQFESFAAQEVQKFGAFVNVAQQLVMQEFQSIDWNELSRNDPIEYVAKKQAFDAKNGQLQQMIGAYQEYNARVSQAQQERYMQHLAGEQQRLSSLIPEWSNPQVAESERVATAKWLKDKGVSEYAINTLADASLVAVLRNAMKSEGVTSKSPEVEKKLRAAPKLVKPGQSVDAKQRNQEGLRDLREQIRKTGGKGGSLQEYLIRTGKV